MLIRSQVTKTVSKVLDILDERSLLLKRSGEEAEVEDAEAPKDNKAKVIAELVETERKYVQYLEILQVRKTFKRRLFFANICRIICENCKLEKSYLPIRHICSSPTSMPSLTSNDDS